ncbi:MAG: tyrosine--tRNA ligase [Actinomycetota bacterium]|nr:tyrosine--tRNA ligase [Actinomycetota bacterium]
MQSKVSDDLKRRGLVNQITSEKVYDLIDNGDATAYIGFDPTAASLHLGNLIQLLLLRRLQLGGNRPIVVAGGGTAMVGDPSGRSSERSLLDDEAIEYNLAKVGRQLEAYLDFSGGPKSAILVNNRDWLEKISFISFLRDPGKFVTVNQMLAKDSVSSRISSEHGISFTEFTYMLMQAYDFGQLSDSYGCNMQLGGSDQWGNITVGIDYISKSRGREVYGITTPLLTKSDGTKFGKSVGGAIYLDSELTSQYEFYQFFLRSDDSDIEKLLKVFTFYSLNEIDEIVRSSIESPEKRIGQYALARSITEFIHGKEGLELAVAASEALFADDIASVEPNALRMALSGAPRSTISRSRLKDGATILEVAIESGLVPSRSEGRKLIKAGGLYLTGSRIADEDTVVTLKDQLSIGALLLRKGKSNYLVVDLTD